MRRILAAALGLLMLAGCYARCDITYRKHQVEYGETALASVTCRNTGYFVFGLLPICSGMPWREGLLKDWSPGHDWFDDHVNIDDNMDMLRLAAREVGSSKIGNLRTEIDDNMVWSFFIIDRRSITTTATILKHNDD